MIKVFSIFEMIEKNVIYIYSDEKYYNFHEGLLSQAL